MKAHTLVSKLSFSLCLSLALAPALLPSSACAQPRRELRQDRREIRQDKQEVRQDQRQLQDDLRDARRYANLLRAFDEARVRNDPALMAQVDQRVLAALAGEIRESSREVVQKSNEAARSQAEVARSRNEVGRDVVRGQPVRAADDRRDLRDDRRDARDDRRDANREMMDNGRLRSLHEQYSALANRFDPPTMERKRQILNTLNGMASAELRQDHQEVREDRRELREDRGERREDRRQIR